MKPFRRVDTFPGRIERRDDLSVQAARAITCTGPSVAVSVQHETDNYESIPLRSLGVSIANREGRESVGTRLRHLQGAGKQRDNLGVLCREPG